MSSKLLWTGLTILVAFSEIFPSFPAVSFIGSLVMVVGLVLMWLDK